ncbi:hypothetical protein PHYC_02488 [Phycisphaerales bacterium]|nr:hypothetical protein PHYC_02488 [Phycisphaerales bacterium]
MQHRHLDTNEWTLAAIDSALEYGDLADWRELFTRARSDRELARRILRICHGHYIEGSTPMARGLVLKLWPELAGEA